MTDLDWVSAGPADLPEVGIKTVSARTVFPGQMGGYGPSLPSSGRAARRRFDRRGRG